MPTLNSPSLKERVFRASGWSLGGYGIGQVIRLGSNLLMTRLLAPEMFGIMAVANMVNMIFGMLADIGLRQHIVQSHRGDDPEFLDTAWTIQFARGVLMWLAACVLSLI